MTRPHFTQNINVLLKISWGIYPKCLMEPIFEPVKHIPVKIIFYPGDDEFSAGGSLLLDSSATDFLGFETLAFLVTILSRKLTE